MMVALAHESTLWSRPATANLWMITSPSPFRRKTLETPAAEPSKLDRQLHLLACQHVLLLAVGERHEGIDLLEPPRELTFVDGREAAGHRLIGMIEAAGFLQQVLYGHHGVAVERLGEHVEAGVGAVRHHRREDPAQIGIAKALLAYALGDLLEIGGPVQQHAHQLPFRANLLLGR